MEGVKLSNDNKIKKTRNVYVSCQFFWSRIFLVRKDRQEPTCLPITLNNVSTDAFYFLSNLLACCLAEFAEQQSKYELKGDQRVINMATDLQFINKTSVISTNKTIDITIQGSMQKMIYKKKLLIKIRLIQ